MPVVKLTPQFIENELQCPDGKKLIEYCDKVLPGLYIGVRNGSPGKGTYYLRYKDENGKTCHQKIGRSTDISLSDAIAKAKKLKAEIALGANPREEARAKKAVPTLTEFMEDHYMPYVTPRKRSWSDDAALFRRRIKAVFGHKRLNQITRHQIQTFHTSLRDEGLAAASCNHYIKLIRHAFNLAIQWDMLEINPAAKVPLFTEDNKVEHYLEKEELERLLHVLNAAENRNVPRIAMFLLSTGARLNEVLHAQWRLVDKDNRIWRIPAAHSKSKKVRSVPLNDSAIEILNELDTEGDYEYSFVNKATEKPYTSIHKVWNRIRIKAGLPHLRIHDLRHQYASFLVNSGRTLYEVQAILGHSDPTVTQRYAHLSTKSLQGAADCASEMINGAMGGSA